MNRFTHSQEILLTALKKLGKESKRRRSISFKLASGGGMMTHKRGLLLQLKREGRGRRESELGSREPAVREVTRRDL